MSAVMAVATALIVTAMMVKTMAAVARTRARMASTAPAEEGQKARGTYVPLYAGAAGVEKREVAKAVVASNVVKVAAVRTEIIGTETVAMTLAIAAKAVPKADRVEAVAGMAAALTMVARTAVAVLAAAVAIWVTAPPPASATET